MLVHRQNARDVFANSAMRLARVPFEPVNNLRTDRPWGSMCGGDAGQAGLCTTFVACELVGLAFVSWITVHV